MTESPDNIILHHLKALREDQQDMRREVIAMRADMTSGFKDVNSKITLLADGLVTVRHEVHKLTNEMQVLTLSVAGQAERLSEVERRLGQIEDRLFITGPKSH
jgi:DNA repair ATPase RecN